MLSTCLGLHSLASLALTEGLTAFVAAVWGLFLLDITRPHLSIFPYSVTLICGPLDVAHRVVSGAGGSSVGAVTIHPYHGGPKKTVNNAGQTQRFSYSQKKV